MKAWRRSVAVESRPHCGWLATRLPLLAALTFASGLAGAQDFLDTGPDVVVQTTHGPVVGVQHERVEVFRGIPYAKAPIGELRFRQSVPPAKWARPRAARVRAPACPQLLDLDDPAEDGDSNISEDCLTVNIWTPRADSKSRPVMVFIHGGSLEEGSAADTWYDGSVLADRGDVVVVSLQYRLGAFGFLELGDIGGAPFADSGNLGILDQIVVLQWVHQNITRFGGDPGNVTVFGESAGGASIHGLLAIPAARDLFHKAIIESGDPGQFLPKTRATEIAREFMSLAHVTTASALQRLSMEEILRSQSQLFARGYGSATFAMVEDGRTLDRTPIQALAADPSLSKPLLIGTNSEEMRYWIALDYSPIDEQPETILRERLRRVFGTEAMGLVDAYKRDSAGYQEAVTKLLGDAVFRMPSIRLAEINSSRQPTFMYLFTYRSLTKGPTGLEYGAMHGLELAFVFHVDSSMGYTYVGPKGSWTHLSDQMVKAWTHFARTGDPNNPQLPPWPRYDSDGRATMEFGQHSDVTLDPYGAERRAWDAIPSERFEDGEVVRLADLPSAQNPGP
jgi:para-nitrobenzyl esterase